MKVILWMAMSINGIIARENNSEDFISHDNWLEWIKALKKSGAVIWGRKTYEIVKTWDKQYINDLKGIQAIIISSDPNYLVEDGFILVSSPKNAIKQLENLGFKSVILTGGATNNSSFAKAGLIDEIIVDIESVIIGKGIPLFKPEVFDLKLKLLKIKKINDKIIQLHYQVIKN